jgi:PAS domain S-box-containing protein
MLRRVDSSARRETRLVGVIFGAFSLFSLARVFVELTVPPSPDLFTSGPYDVLAVMVYQTLFVSLTFSLFLMVNRRLLRALEVDIAERKRVEESLRESEERFALAFRTSPYAITITRMKDWRFIDVNEAFCSIFGLTREEAAGSTSRELSLWVDEKDSGRVAKRLLSGQKIAGEEFQFKRGNGQIITGLFSAEVSLLRNEKYILSSIADITDRKRAEELVKLSADKLARSNAELERFAYVAAHDLQEPLRMVARFTQLLSERYSGKLDETADGYIQFAADGATRMQELIRDLLEYARVNSKKLELRPVECAAVVRSTVQNLKAAIEESGAVVEWDDPLPVLMADPAQLGQLFQNLIGNAVKFRGQAPPRVHIAAEDHGADWLFSVRDNGIGIDPGQAGRVFQIFQRLHTREEYPGTGIGLAVCKKVVERHGGRIWVESQPGAGSNFCFTLPKVHGNGVEHGSTEQVR